MPGTQTSPAPARLAARTGDGYVSGTHKKAHPMTAHVVRRLEGFRRLWLGGALRQGRTAGLFIAFLGR